MMARENQVFKSTRRQVSEGRRVIKWNKYPQLTLNLGKAHTWVGGRALAIPSSGRNTGRSAYLTDGLRGKGIPQTHHVTVQLTLHQYTLILPLPWIISNFDCTVFGTTHITDHNYYWNALA